MKIFLIGVPTAYNYLVPLLQDQGHEAMLVEFRHPVQRQDFLQQLSEFKPDVVVNGVPSFSVPESSDYTYLGTNWVSARLQHNKWETREKAGELGWKLPTVLEECVATKALNYDKTVYVKAKDSTTLEWVTKIEPNTTEIFYEDDIPVFVEEDIRPYTHLCAFFTVSNKKYSITQTMIWKEVEELVGGYALNYTIDKYSLTDEQLAIFLPKCQAWLDYIAPLGGSYEGWIEGALTANNELYWLGQFCRPDFSATGLEGGTAQDWLDSLMTDPAKAPKVTYSR